MKPFRHAIAGGCAVLSLFVAGVALAQPFVFPVAGTRTKTWAIENYVDLDARTNLLRDYRGGPWSYDGHDALDINIANFEKQKQGVNVLAADDGKVTSTHDGEPDRNSYLDPITTGPNYVYIDHGAGVVTGYLHLRKNSVRVKRGDRVVRGQVIGKVGSSGNSSWPHLHFSVYKNGRPVETMLQPKKWWIKPPPYSGNVAVTLGGGVAKDQPTEREMLNGPKNENVFYREDGAGQQAWTWMYLYFGPKGRLQFTYTRPNGSVFSTFGWDLNGKVTGWWQAYTTLPNQPELGRWQVKATFRGKTVHAKSFYVRSRSGTAEAFEELVLDAEPDDAEAYDLDDGSAELDHLVNRRELGRTASYLTNLAFAEAAERYDATGDAYDRFAYRAAYEAVRCDEACVALKADGDGDPAESEGAYAALRQAQAAYSDTARRFALAGYAASGSASAYDAWIYSHYASIYGSYDR